MCDDDKQVFAHKVAFDLFGGKLVLFKDNFNEGDLERLFSILSANSSEQPASAPSHISYRGLQALPHFNGMKSMNC